LQRRASFDFIDQKAPKLTDLYQMIKRQDCDNKEQDQRSADKTDKLENFSHVRIGKTGRGLSRFAGAGQHARRDITCGHARGTSLAAQDLSTQKLRNQYKDSPSIHKRNDC
jgi:hypothetical protein